MDYYSTLGLNRGASAEEIKKAYKKMAMKHHPDRGGDEKKFKEVEEAYRTLSDPQKKQMFDMGMDPNRQHHGQGFYNQGPFEFHFDTGNLNDMFNHFGFGSRPMRKNKSVSIAVRIKLEEVLTGKEINAEVGLPSGKKKILNIEIPPGIENGQQVRYEGMGDNSINSLRPGDLIVNIYIDDHPRFRREHSNLIYDVKISVWEALLGCNLIVQTLDNKKLDITIPPGTQPETVLSCSGEGLPNLRSRQRGNLLIKIKVDIPKHLSADQKTLIEKIKNGV